MSTITKRASGRWQAKIRQAGQRPISRSFQTKADARAWARERERDLERGTINVAATLAEKTRLHELVERYQREVTPEKKGARGESHRLDMFAHSDLASLFISNITPQLVADWRDARLDEVSAATVNRELNILGHVFTVAIKEWGVSSTWGNPVHMIRRPKVGSSGKRERRLEGDEESLLLDAAREIEAEGWKLAQERSSTPPIPLADMIRLAIETAMRRGELVAIRRADISLSARTLHIGKSKTGEARTVALSSRAISTIRRQPARTDGRLWPPTAPESVTRAFAKACKRAGIHGLRLHDLRHEGTSRLFELGLDVTEVASITGHKSLQMLHRYTHHRAERLAAKLG